MEVDLIFPCKAKNEGKITQEQIRKFYGSKVKNVWFLWQPARLTVIVENFSKKVHLKNFAKELLYICQRPRYQKIFREGDYRFIHLNSVILYPMLDKRWPMFLHVRESVCTSLPFCDRAFNRKMNQAHGVFFINPEVKERVHALTSPELMLINPFDQTGVSNVNVQHARALYELTGKETVYAIIGSIVYFKGVDFVVRAFQKAKLKNSTLLIVGNDTQGDSYIQQVRKLVANDPNIRFTGEIEDTEQIYRTIDYVVRGDIVTGLGRTVYEALYSGCGAVIPRDFLTQNVPDITPDMEERVHFYSLQDESALVRVFKDTQCIRFEKRTYHSNVKQYVRKFLEFVQENC